MAPKIENIIETFQNRSEELDGELEELEEKRQEQILEQEHALQGFCNQVEKKIEENIDNYEIPVLEKFPDSSISSNTRRKELAVITASEKFLNFQPYPLFVYDLIYTAPEEVGKDASLNLYLGILFPIEDFEQDYPRVVESITTEITDANTWCGSLGFVVKYTPEDEEEDGGYIVTLYMGKTDLMVRVFAEAEERSKD